MKVKKLLALVLSALMAVTMLAACGGGGGVSSVSLNRSAIVDMVVADGYDEITLVNSSELNAATKEVAEMLKDYDYSQESANVASNALMSRISEGTIFNPAILKAPTDGTDIEDWTNGFAAYWLESFITAIGRSDATFSVSAAEYTTNDGMDLILVVVAAR